MIPCPCVESRANGCRRVNSAMGGKELRATTNMVCTGSPVSGILEVPCSNLSTLVAISSVTIRHVLQLANNTHYELGH